MKTVVLALVVVLGCAPVSAATPIPTPQVIYVAPPPPTFSMWSTTATIAAGHFVEMTLPDTFTVHITFTATTPVRARVMALDEFARFIYRAPAKSIDYGTSTTFDVTFHDAEGCAGYVLVIDAADDSIVSPNVTIDRNPSKTPTGVCAP